MRGGRSRASACWRREPRRVVSVGAAAAAPRPALVPANAGARTDGEGGGGGEVDGDQPAVKVAGGQQVVVLVGQVCTGRTRWRGMRGRGGAVGCRRSAGRSSCWSGLRVVCDGDRQGRELGGDGGQAAAEPGGRQAELASGRKSQARWRGRRSGGRSVAGGGSGAPACWPAPAAGGGQAALQRPGPGSRSGEAQLLSRPWLTAMFHHRQPMRLTCGVGQAGSRRSRGGGGGGGRQ